MTNELDVAATDKDWRSRIIAAGARAMLYDERTSSAVTPPAELAEPILKDQPGQVLERPANILQVTLDGEVTTSFEWMGAGRYRPGGLRE